MVVGVPTAELEVQDAVYSSAAFLVPPGVGRSTFVMREVASRDGRVDVLVLVANTRAVSWAAQHAVRFETERQCHTATLSISERANGDTQHVASSLGVSRGHASSLLRSVEQLVVDERVILRQAQVIAGSVAIETKVNGWLAAFQQTERYRGMVNQTAIGLPAHVASRVPPVFTKQTGSGLITVENHEAQWRRLPTRRPISRGANLWLLELLLRHL